MSMTLAARSNHFHHVSGAAPQRFRPLIWFRRRMRSRPGSTLAHCAFAGVAAVILFNAVSSQRGAIPRSFIAEQPASGQRAPVGQQAAPAPPPRPAELQGQAIRPTPASAGQPQPASAAPAQRQPTAAREIPARDPIGELIRTGQVAAQAAPPDALRPPGNVGERVPQEMRSQEMRPVLAAQRALVRIGHGVKADGVFGEETRAAIERFERERRIPVTRDLSPRTLRELAAASGIRME